MGPDPVAQPLCSLDAGGRGNVLSVAPSGQATRLRELGICEGQELEVLCGGDPMICRVGACRVGICAKLASAIRVST